MPALARVKELLAQHGDKVERVVDKAAVTIDRRTAGQHRTKIDQGVRTIKGYVRTQRPGPPPPPPRP